MSQCQYTPLNFSCSLLLKLPKLEGNSEYLNFLVCRSMPSPLPIDSLFFFSTSSKTISRMNCSINWKGLSRNGGSPPWQNYQEINFFLKLWPCSWLNQAKSNKKIINNYFCVWTCLNSHGKLLFTFKFEQLVIKGSIDH